MKRLLILTLWLFVSCDLQAQTNLYDVTLFANPDTAMASYKVWFWQGSDTLNSPIESYDYVGAYNHDSLMTVFPDSNLCITDIYLSAEDGNFLKAAVKAIWNNGKESPNYAISPAYKKTDSRLPLNVRGVGVQK